MGIAAVQKNGITNDEFKEIHYTVTTPNTPANMGGFGVHITLVRHNDTTKSKNRVHVYFAVLDGVLLKLKKPGQPSTPITQTSIFRDFMTAALAFFKETCAKKGWALPVTATTTTKLDLSSQSQFPGLPSAPKPIVTPPTPPTQVVAMPSMTSTTPMNVIFASPPSPAPHDPWDVVQSVLLASGAFDD